MSNNPYAAPASPIQMREAAPDSLTLLLLRVDLFVSSAFTLRAAILLSVLALAIFGEGNETLGVELRVLLISDFLTGLLELVAGFVFLGYDVHALLSKRRSIVFLLVAHGALLLFLILRYQTLYSDFFDSEFTPANQRIFSTWLPCIARLLYWPVCKLGYRSLQKVWPSGSQSV